MHDSSMRNGCLENGAQVMSYLSHGLKHQRSWGTFMQDGHTKPNLRVRDLMPLLALQGTGRVTLTCLFGVYLDFIGVLGMFVPPP